MFEKIKNWIANLHKMPPGQMAQFREEGLLLSEEWIKAKLTYLDFRAPGKRFLRKSIWFRSNLVITNKRVFATAYTNLAIDVPYTDVRFRRMNFSVDGDRLLVTFDAGLFQENWSGKLEYRFLLSDPPRAVSMIKEAAGYNG